LPRLGFKGATRGGIKGAEASVLVKLNLRKKDKISDSFCVSVI